MRAILTSAVSMSTALLAIACATSASAGDDRPRRLGDHPAVVVQRLHKSAGYDYASKFYPHPAGLRLYAASPRDETDMARITGANPATPAAPAEPPVGRQLGLR